MSAATSEYVVPDRFGADGEMANPTEPIQWSDFWSRPGDSEIRAAAILIPLGLVSCGVTLLIGLIVLAVGVAQNDSWDGRTPASEGWRRGSEPARLSAPRSAR